MKRLILVALVILLGCNLSLVMVKKSNNVNIDANTSKRDSINIDVDSNLLSKDSIKEIKDGKK